MVHRSNSGVGDISASFQTGPPSLLYNGYQVCVPGVKWPGHGINHPPLSSAKIKERVENTYTPPLGPHGKLYLIIIIIIISFMQGIYTWIPKTNYVPREYSVAAILSLPFMVYVSLALVLNLLYFCISIFQSMCAVPNMTVFCSSLT
jgi:hypothetical protein